MDLYCISGALTVEDRETHVESRGGEVRGAELAEEHLLIPSRGARARHPDGLSHGRHRAAVERVVLVLQSPRRPEAIRRKGRDEDRVVLSYPTAGEAIQEAGAHRDGGGDGDGAGDARGGDDGGGDDGADERGVGVGPLGRGREGHVHAQALEEGHRPLSGLCRRKPLRIHRRRQLQRHLFHNSQAPFTFASALLRRGW